MFKITVHAGESSTDTRPPSTKTHVGVLNNEVVEYLQMIGLEWKTADYFPNRQVVVIIEPMIDVQFDEIQEGIKRAAEALEGTGLL